MDIYLVNPTSRPYTIEANPSLSLCSPSLGSDRKSVTYDINVLESYYYVRQNKTIDRLLPYINKFLLDSGAFTFLSNSETSKPDWDRYIEEYADYINSRGIKLFFELDIDRVVGLREVERLRAKLERLTGLRPIPVWHKNRGKEYWLRMIKEYPYVALGGIAIQEIRRNRFETFFPWFINTAHESDVKIHGLGYTSLSGLRRYHFDSVDSTAWIHGNRGGYLYRFNAQKGEMDKINPPEGKRLSSKAAALHNFNEWVKFMQYAKKRM